MGAQQSGVETKNETFVWCGARICQKRAANGTTVLRSYFGQGFEEAGPPAVGYLYTRDHLGSVREVVASDGTTVASRMSYDPWGKVTETGAGAKSDFGFTGHYFDRPTGLALAWWRGYDPGLGRWVSMDPIGLAGGLNLYGYTQSDPANYVDASGQHPAVAIAIVFGAALVYIYVDTFYVPEKEAENSGFPGGVDGPQDACRHCLASCVATGHYSSAVASLLADLNEADQHDPGTEMDRHNNSFGRACGERVKGDTAKECREMCRDALGHGLQTAP